MTTPRRTGRRTARPSRPRTADKTATPDATRPPSRRRPPSRPRRRHRTPPSPSRRRRRRSRRQTAGDDPAALQLQAFNLNNAGQPEQALPLAQKAVELCAGSTAVSPCAFALYEHARALLATGDPGGAIAALEERKQRFPDNQPGAVEKLLAAARKAAGQ